MMAENATPTLTAGTAAESGANTSGLHQRNPNTDADGGLCPFDIDYSNVNSNVGGYGNDTVNVRVFDQRFEISRESLDPVISCTKTNIINWMVGIGFNLVVFAILVGLANTDRAWMFSFVLSILYSAFLWRVVLPFFNTKYLSSGAVDVSGAEAGAFGMLAYVIQRPGYGALPTSEPAAAAASSGATPPSENPANGGGRGMLFAHSVWYFLAIMSLAVPPAYVVPRLFACRGYDNRRDARPPAVYWDTDVTALPSREVVEWLDNPPDDHVKIEHTCHMQLPDKTPVSYFHCRDPYNNKASHNDVRKSKPPLRERGRPLIVKVGNNTSRQVLNDYSVFGQVVAVDEHTICFNGDKAKGKESYLVCGSYGNFREIRKHSDRPSGLEGINKQLWFMQALPEEDISQELNSKQFFIPGFDYPRRQFPDGVGGKAVISMDPHSFKETKWSVLKDQDFRWHQQPSTDRFYQCRGVQINDGKSLGYMFLVGLPLIVFSAKVWMEKAVPSAPTAMYFGFIIFAIFVSSLNDSVGPGSQGFINARIVGTSVWIAFCVLQFASASSSQAPSTTQPPSSAASGHSLRAPFWWSLYAAIAVVTMFYPSFLTAKGLTLANAAFLVYLPIAVISLLAGGRYLFCASTMGFVIKALVIGSRDDTHFIYPSVFFALALAACVLSKWKFTSEMLNDWCQRRFGRDIFNMSNGGKAW